MKMPPIDTSFARYSDFPPEVLKHLKDVDTFLKGHGENLKPKSVLRKQNAEILAKAKNQQSGSTDLKKA